MNDIQRWSHEHPTECVQVRYENGEWVAYADHVEALRQAVETAMQIGREIEKDNHAAGLCEPSYTNGREYQQQRLTNHDMHSGLACLTSYEQGQRDMLAKCIEAVEGAINDRIRDLRSCGKDDNCDEWAEACDVALDDALIALRALQEVDTPQQEINEHINFDMANRIGDDTATQNAGREPYKSPNGQDKP